MSLGDDEHESHFAEAFERERQEKRDGWRLVGIVFGAFLLLIAAASVVQEIMKP